MRTLGTRPTIESAFYPERLSRGGVETVPTFDTTALHVEAAVAFALGKGV
jgi:aspartate/glutamate racemase